MPSAKSWLLGATLPLSLLLAACGDPFAPPPEPSFVVVSVDTLNRDALRAFDPAAQELPTIDRFSREAVRFSQAFSTASWTLPAQASILTGLYPHRHGAVHRHVRLSSHVPTLAETLREAGYLNAAFTHGGFVNRKFGLARGFDLYDRWRSPLGAELGFDIPRGGRLASPRGKDQFDRAVAFLRQQGSSGRPFFLFVQTYSVHDYFRIHPWIDTPGEERSPERIAHYLGCIMGKRSCSAEDWQRLERYYRDEIRYLDEGFGRLLAAIESDAGRPTYVVFVSDHGEGFDVAGGRIHHGGRLHDDLIRVPLLIRGPGLKPADVEEPVSLVDLAPSLLHLAGLEAPEGMDGRTLLDGTRPRSGDAARSLYATDYLHVWRDGRRRDAPEPRERPLGAAVIDGGYRLLWSGSSPVLHYVPDDPGQLRDLSAAERGVARRLRAALQPILAHRVPLAPWRQDREVERELESLGYL